MCWTCKKCPWNKVRLFYVIICFISYETIGNKPRISAACASQSSRRVAFVYCQRREMFWQHCIVWRSVRPWPPVRVFPWNGNVRACVFSIPLRVRVVRLRWPIPIRRGKCVKTCRCVTWDFFNTITVVVLRTLCTSIETNWTWIKCHKVFGDFSQFHSHLSWNIFKTTLAWCKIDRDVTIRVNWFGTIGGNFNFVHRNEWEWGIVFLGFWHVSGSKWTPSSYQTVTCSIVVDKHCCDNCYQL